VLRCFVGGNTGFLSARGHSSSGNRKAAFAQPLGSGAGAATGYHTNSNDAWEDDGQDDLSHSHSVGGHTHMSNGGHSGTSHYSGNTQTYNAAPSRIAYHNSDSGAGDAFGYSAGGVNNTGVRAQSPFANAARGTYRGDDYGGSSQAYQSQQNSQRSDAALRASRGDFGVGQDRERDRDRFDVNIRSPTGGQGQFTPTKDTQRRDYSPRGSERSDSTSNNSRHAQSPVVDRVSAALAAKAAAESSKSALRLAQQQRNNAQSSRHSAVPNVSSSPPRVATNHVQVGGGSGAGSDNVSMSAAESIRRTQEMLSRRGLGGSGTGTATDSTASGAPRERTPNSGRGVAKLTESIQQANSLYPPSPQRYQQDANRCDAAAFTAPCFPAVFRCFACITLKISFAVPVMQGPSAVR
jgi:hypothetical protein